MSKSRVLVFGAGSMGDRFYRLNRWRFRIVGFIDNDPEKAGMRLHNRHIYSPKQLANINYDKIVIASDYQAEIYGQLINELGIKEDKIEICFFESTTIFESFLNRLSDFRFRLLLNVPHVLLPLINKTFFRQSGLTLRPLVWLDELKSNKVKVLRQAESGITIGPNFIGKGATKKNITIPEVNLYRFENTQIGSVGRSFLLSDGRIAVERVITARTNNSNYSARHLVMHNNHTGLVRKTKAIKIEKGILISGISETNYYHWIVEILSQLEYVSELFEKYGDYYLLIPAWVEKIPSINEFFTYFNIHHPLIRLDHLISYQVDKLLVISSPNFHVPHLSGSPEEHVENSYCRPGSIDYLRGLVVNAYTNLNLKNKPKRLFLARKKGKRNYNQDEVKRLLLTYGFAQVFLEDYSFLEQVELFQNAEIIIGPPGAAWANLLFCRQGIKALSWIAEESGESSCFSNIAYHLDIRLDYLRFRSGRGDSKDLYLADYVIDLQAVERWLETECHVE